MTIPIIGTALDAISGIASANQARNAFKSRYQDTVADMKKAGLNPALAYGQGGGNPQTSDLPHLGESMVRGLQGKATSAQAAANAENTKAQTDLLRAQTTDLIQQVKLRNAEILTDTARSGAQGGLALRQQDQVNEAIKGLEYDNAFKKGTLDDRIALVTKDLKRRGIEIDIADLRKILLNLSRPKARAEGAFYEGLGQGAPYLNSAAQILNMIRGR